MQKKLISLLLIFVIIFSTIPVYASNDPLQIAFYALEKQLDQIRGEGSGGQYVNDSLCAIEAGYVLGYTESISMAVDVFLYQKDVRKTVVHKIKNINDVIKVNKLIQDGAELVKKPQVSNNDFKQALSMGYSNFTDIVKNFYKIKIERELKYYKGKMDLISSLLSYIDANPSFSLSREEYNSLKILGIDMDDLYSKLYNKFAVATGTASPNQAKCKISIDKFFIGRGSTITIRVKVMTPYGKPIKNADVNVSMTYPNGECKMIATSSNLAKDYIDVPFVFNRDCASGCYKIIATSTKEGYSPGSAELSITIY